ncbi:MAG: hypothetical protein IKQ40_07345 [Lachnospiraceae bacterium]|nr:hypothetical protein [Lachnospiraceae bacterium]
MTSEKLRSCIVNVLENMKDKAVDMGISGVAVASVLNKGETVDLPLAERSRKKTSRLPNTGSK